MIRTLAVAALVLSGLTMHVNAQTMYRCGKTYQDRPCDGGQEATKVLSAARSAAPTQQSSSGDADCAQRGVAAQKIAWNREAGAMLDQQLAKAKNDGERELIASVYAKRGTSGEIRSAIEAECVTEKEKAARMEALTGIPRGAAPQSVAPGTSSRQSDASRQNAEASEAKMQTARTAEAKKMRCERLRTQIEEVRNKQRQGGDVETMETLNQEKRDLDKAVYQNGC